MNKLRYRVFKKIAQTAPPGNLPTEEVTQTQTVSGSPPAFVATDFYPSLIIGFQGKNIPIINGLSNLMNLALFYNSAGQVHLPWMRSVNFNFDSSNTPSPDLKNLMELSKLLYQQLYTSKGADFKQPLTPEEVAERVNILKSSNFLNNLSSVQPTGQLSSKIGGNIKTLINDYLLRLK